MSEIETMADVSDEELLKLKVVFKEYRRLYACLTELQARRAAEAKAAEALRPFAKLADLPALQPDVADDHMPLNVGLMNGNVTQTVIRDQLRVSDLRAARAALGARDD